MGIKSLNEPAGPGHIEMVFPASINEPPAMPAPPPPVAAHLPVIEVADPDELEDELEQAQEEGDFKPTHHPRRKKRH